jgi:hypothetical protein
MHVHIVIQMSEVQRRARRETAHRGVSFGGLGLPFISDLGPAKQSVRLVAY